MIKMLKIHFIFLTVHAILTTANLSISLQHHPRPEVVEDECLASLGDAEFPRQTSTLDAGPAAGSCPSVMAGNGDVLCLTLKIDVHGKYTTTIHT